MNNCVYNENAKDQLLTLYYLISWNDCSENKNIEESVSAILYLWKIIGVFYKYHPKKSKATFLLLDIALPITQANGQINHNAQTW